MSILQGYDYAWGYGPKLPAALKKAKTAFVIRYIGTSSKCISPGELKALQKAGIAVGLVYETTGVTFTGGREAGLRDGAAAAAAADRLGTPAGTPIFFAIDTDTHDYPQVVDYYDGVVANTGGFKARLYASYYVIQAMTNAGHWQTYAWSGGHVSGKADLYQYHNGVTVGGVSMDQCRTLNSKLGNRGGWLTWAPPAPAVIEPPATISYEGWTYTRASQIVASAVVSAAAAPSAPAADATPPNQISHGG